MKILRGILITIFVISFATALQGASAYEYGDSKYTEQAGLSQVLTPVMKTSGSSGGSGIDSTQYDNTGVTGDEATNMINTVSGMIKTIIILSVVIILTIIALIYFFFKKRRTV